MIPIRSGRILAAALVAVAAGSLAFAPPGLAATSHSTANDVRHFMQVDAADFISATQGWMVVNRQPVSANPPSNLYVYSTTTGGRTWRRVDGPLGDLPSVSFGATAISFRNTRDGVMLLSIGAGACQAEMAVLATTDGGKTWQRWWQHPRL